ncbi:putative lipoprotein [Melioribacter roseus P3M-2]|uniref:Putative lipoprotein n=1 Tax=Melioribacter roseus (strain DSM 23840 / JCM 17771 / VKM B-2668 / P3M-2) TaxID=1191523 RepID=I6ZQ91_MELRP|nr:DUF4374 domain-containing protein [Melioribacter roseus]AFN74239.1 putative lipoprotein [Melioribacter roseus P3M-2]
MSNIVFKNKLKLILSIIFSAIIVISCGESGATDPVETEISKGITMAFKTTGGDETEYLITQENIMEGEISAVGQGIELTGWRFFHKVGNTLFASGYSEDNQCAAYVKDQNGNIVKKGEFIFENSLEMFGNSDDNQTMLAMEIPRAGFANRRLYFVDVNTALVSKIVGTRIFESQEDSLVAWPTALQVRGDKLFIPFHKLDAKGWFTTPSPDSAFIAVYSYPDVGAVPEKIISDPRTSNIGVNGAATGLIQTENGDLYSFSCGASMAGFSPASSKPSGILRIKAGSADFDPNYFFNVESITGGKIFWFDYLGNNKALARILTDDNGGLWTAFGRTVFNQKLVILDLVNQTATDVANIPLHAKRYTSTPLLVEDGKVYVSVETAGDAYVYQIDIESASAVRGAKINGKTIKGFFRM